MRLLPNGPDIPQELLTAQERGEVLFICGAGVSMTLGLPSFRGLVEAVYAALRENWQHHPAEREVMNPNGRLAGQYDRVLRFLERRLTAPGGGQAGGLRERLRAAVRANLEPPTDQQFDLGAHAALLELSRDAENNIRLVTTNFDTLFERAWPRPGRAPSYAGAAMPQPKTAGCTGVLHLHGRLADRQLGWAETDLVLTSAEFGDAYLRSGWASRYVYDLVRAYTVVLVGYQADDPPMRYLLEVLEADRQRYSDLQTVYAFTAAGDDELVTRALWEGKGVVPILHHVDAEDYSPLYRTIIEWRAYARDPTTWRREQLRTLLASDPAGTAATVERASELLRHGDASLLLPDLDPPPAWLALLHQQRIFDNGAATPGPWLAARLNDPDMIRAVAAHSSLDEDSVWHLERALDRRREEIGLVRVRAWETLLLAKKPQPQPDYGFTWYRMATRIRAGETGYEARCLVANLLRPRLNVNRAYRMYHELDQTEIGSPVEETINSFMRLDFKTSEDVSTDEIVASWAPDATSTARLLQMLERTLLDALEQAEDVGFTVGYDWSDHDTPSIAPHAQNNYHTGFYPIVRVMADLWERLAHAAPDPARSLTYVWRDAPFLLLRRLAIFAATNPIHSADDLVQAITQLDEHDFWLSGAQVEVMRGLVARWDEFTSAAKTTIERRIAAGIPRSLFPEDAFDGEGWESVFDNSIYRRLTRLESSGRTLSEDSLALMAQIAQRHPAWHPSPGDRDDFHTWHETRIGFDGHIDLLKDVPEATLVGEALRIEGERRSDQGNLWRLFCSSDPKRAFTGLEAQAKGGDWNAYAWRSFFWAANDSIDEALKRALSDAVLDMPQATLAELVGTVADWIRKHGPFLDAHPCDGGANRLWRLWDHLAALVYADNSAAEPRDDDLITQALNQPGGVLAWTLVSHLSAAQPPAGAGLGQLEPRFTRVVRAPGESGLLGRVHFARGLSALHRFAPDWTTTEMLPRFQLEHPEALAMWKANAETRADSPILFNALKTSLLAAILRPELSNDEGNNLATRLFDILILRQLGQAQDYALTPDEVRDLLTVSPEHLREHFAWLLRRLQGDKSQEKELPAEPAARWRQVVSPIFTQIWPLDTRLRSKHASQNLVMMVMETGEAFSEAVDAVIDVLGPYEFHSLKQTFRLDAAYAALLEQYPRSIIKLANAMIDSRLHPIPRDLGQLLDESRKHNSQIMHEAAFHRLDGFRRLGGA